VRDSSHTNRIFVRTCVRCAYGSPGVQPTFRFLPDGVDATHTLKRCRVSMHPRCACANFPAPPPMLIAPPPPAMFTNQWDMALPEVTDSSKGNVGALVQRLVNGKTLDLSLRSGPMKLYDCPGEDDGRDTCAIHCASTHLGRVRAFTVTGENVGSPPPSPPPPEPPSPIAPPFAASDTDKFNGCANTCTGVAEDERFCRDGGKGSYSPALCAYGTQVRPPVHP
jgi:hypothetical protein